ncbi:MAG: glycosyltransferase family 4 protein [Verrucomicrobiales bacterium]
MNVLFAPDYSLDNPYQQMLAAALGEQGCTIEFLSHYRRGLPLSRGCNSGSQLLHLHWPEAYFRAGSSRLADWMRALRYPLDLALLGLRKPILVTAHNLLPHKKSPLATINMASTYRRAKRIIAHSAKAADQVAQFYGIDRSKFRVIPHGDLAFGMPALIDQEKAKSQLSLGNQPACLMFGALAPYKGIEEIVEAWQLSDNSAKLYIVGDAFDAAYGTQLEQFVASKDRVSLVRRRVDDTELHMWLSACDCAIYNYSRILTSGSACMARSLGVPIVLPQRLDTLDLGEPHSHVFRFDTVEGNFSDILRQAIATTRHSDDAKDWRTQTSWSRVAADTLNLYREVA